MAAVFDDREAAPQSLVEAAANLEHPRVDRPRLRQFRRRDRSRRTENDGGQPGAGGIGRRRGGRIAGRGADDPAGAALERPGDRDRHPAVS